jgi:hypothetical protein
MSLPALRHWERLCRGVLPHNAGYANTGNTEMIMPKICIQDCHVLQGKKLKLKKDSRYW